ncbi:uncharacterized protein LOC128992755 [Macrosteles quadrilineatus]|uniref:uncharacterized protein LOC128992755 n=1 Tax=Macrosteles quadrilineatus TaxID=74068 RepID=UPI0023E2B6D9|nr:uncharacterized protein LOC128992755 [Macrosteles quadrilineatus]
MMDFRYFVSFNAEFKDAKELYCKGRVECFSPKSKFKLIRHREMQEGDTLYFYLIGYRKPENFQMERVYEVKKNEEGDLEFQEKTSRAALEKEGLWYDQLDKLQETKP